METFMLFIYDRPSTTEPTPEIMETVLAKYFAWNALLKAEGRYVSGEALTDQGAVLKGSTITDGPFAESNEIIGGYYAYKARDLQDAIEVAKGCPAVEFGSTVEVRSIMVFG